MTRSLTVCNVLREGGRWRVHCVDGTFVATTHGTREEAIWAARQHADKLRPSVIRILRDDGSVADEFPYPPRRP